MGLAGHAPPLLLALGLEPAGQRLEPGDGSLGGGLRPLPRRHVQGDAEHARDAASGVAHGDVRGLEDDGPARGRDAGAGGERLPRERALQVGEHVGGVGVELADGAAHGGGRPVLQRGAPGALGKHDDAVGVELEEDEGDRLRDVAERRAVVAAGGGHRRVARHRQEGRPLQRRDRRVPAMIATSQTAPVWTTVPRPPGPLAAYLSGPMRALRVLIADDHALIRRGVRETLEEAGFVVAGEAADGREALALAREDPDLDLIVADLSMPEVGGLELLARLRAERPALAVLVLSTLGAEEVGLQALQAGAKGFVEKGETPERLVEAVRRVAAGGRAVGPDLAEALAEQALSGGAPPPEALSPRELQVVRAVASGHTRKGIAEAHGIAPSTVSTHRARAMRKLGVETEAALVALALRESLVEG